MIVFAITRKSDYKFVVAYHHEFYR